MARLNTFIYSKIGTLGYLIYIKWLHLRGNISGDSSILTIVLMGNLQLMMFSLSSTQTYIPCLPEIFR